MTGATVAEVSPRHELTRQHIHQWRRELKRKGLWPCSVDRVFLALEASVGAEARASDGGAVGIVLRNGRILPCRGGVDDADLARLIRLVEAT